MPEPERSLSDPAPEPPGGPAAPSPAAGPLGNPGGPAPVVPAASIVDTILDLDALLSADVRRAEKTARFCIEPWIEAEIDELEAELGLMLDSRGVVLNGYIEAAEAKALEIQAKRVQYGQAFRSVRMGQLPDDKWAAFKTKHRDVLQADTKQPPEFFDDLISVSALRPAMPLEKVKQMRTQLGEPVMDVLAGAAWDVNTKSGVSIPKSLISSDVLSQARRARS